MHIEGTLFKVERSSGKYEGIDYDNVNLTITTDDYQIIELKVKRSELDPSLPLVQGQRYAMEAEVPKGVRLSLKSITAKSADVKRAS